MEWKKAESEYVTEREPLIIFGYQTSYGNKETLTHFASSSGYLNKMSDTSLYTMMSEKQLLYVLHQKDESRIALKYINVPEVILDEFTGGKTIRWVRVGALDGYQQGIVSVAKDKQSSLIMSFNYLNQQDFITFDYFPKEIRFAVGDDISLLLENKIVLNFNVREKPYKASHPFIKGLYQVKIPILDLELDQLSSLRLLKWKLTLKYENREIIGGESGGYGSYTPHKNLMEVTQKLAKEYKLVVRTEIPDYTPLTFRGDITSLSNIMSLEDCYVYLMHDTINGFYKIGISNQPEWREKTLQSEKPTIELLAAKKFIKRKIAAAFEKALHDVYAQKRIRGEWFQLSPDDVSDMTAALLA